MKKAPAAVLPLAMLAAAATGQTTHLVGPGGLTSVGVALSLASAGDVILVQPGSYPAINVSIGVVIRGTGAGVVVQSITANVPSGQVLHVSDIDVALNVVASVAIYGGRAELDHCRMQGPCAVSASDVRFQSCSAAGFSFFGLAKPGLLATGANVTAIDSRFTGAIGSAQAAWSSTVGMQLQDSTLLGSHLEVRGGGGYGGGGSWAPQPAVMLTNGTLWLCDCLLAGGADLGGGGAACPLSVQGAQPARLARCTLQPNCGSTIPNGPLLGVHQPGPLQSPGPVTLEFNTEPSGVVAVYFATGIGNLTIAGLEQPILLDVTSTFHLETMFADATGFASRAWNVPPGLTNWTFFFQAVGTAPAPYLLQLSPVAGGVVR